MSLHCFLILEVVNEAQQVLNFLTSREFQPTNFLKKFLHLVHFEPQFSYKWVLIKKKKKKKSVYRSDYLPFHMQLNWSHCPRALLLLKFNLFLKRSTSTFVTITKFNIALLGGWVRILKKMAICRISRVIPPP